MPVELLSNVYPYCSSPNRLNISVVPYHLKPSCLSNQCVASTRMSSARMSMLFGGGKKKSNFKVNEGTANKGTYVPDGLTKAQYEKVLAEEAKAKETKQKKFPKGKVVETLSDWMNAEAKKGNRDEDLLTNGHRMVKAKYADWYIDSNPQLTRAKGKGKK